MPVQELREFLDSQNIKYVAQNPSPMLNQPDPEV